MNSSEKEGVAVSQIVRCIQTIIEEATSNEFKQNCLDIVDVDDFEKFNKISTRKLRKLLKRRHGSCRKKNTKRNMDISVQTLISNPSKKVPYSPIRKRYRKEPLLEASFQLPSPRNTAIPNINKSNNNETSSRSSSQSISKSEFLNIPNCVDITKLCDLINSADENIDEWITDEQPLAKTAKCERSGDISTKSVETQKFDMEVTEDEVNNNPPSQKGNKLSKPSEKSDDQANTQLSILECTSGNKIAISEIKSGFVNTIEDDSTLGDIKEDLALGNLQVNGTLALKLCSDNDWLEEFKQDEFWGQLASSPNTHHRTEVENDVFDLDTKELFKIDNFQLEE